MKWIIKNGLLLCIGSILLIGVLFVLLQEKIQVTSSTWTALLLIYFLVLSIYSSYEYKRIPVDGEERSHEDVQKNN